MTPHTAAVLIPAWFITLLIAGGIGAWVGHGFGFDRGFDEALGPDPERHRHRIGDPKLPRAGRLELEPPEPPEPPEPLPEPEWEFFSGAQLQPQPGRAEYELLTQAAAAVPEAAPEAAPEAEAEGEPDPWTVTGEIAKMIAETDERIKNMREESNYFQHTIHADGPR